MSRVSETIPHLIPTLQRGNEIQLISLHSDPNYFIRYNALRLLAPYVGWFLLQLTALV